MTNKEAIKHVENMKEGVFLFQPDELYDTIINALKKESKTGHWIPVGHDINDYPYFKCSECGRVDDAKGSWCRWCGCLMPDGENKPIQATKPCNYLPDEEIDVIRHHITDETYQHLLDNK